jgi:hypothetical protein
MFADIKALIARSSPTLAEDVLGLFALVFLLIVGLNAPF